MVREKTCDICGAHYKTTEYSTGITLVCDHLECYECYDLCMDCYSKVKKALGIKEKSEK